MKKHLTFKNLKKLVLFGLGIWLFVYLFGWNFIWILYYAHCRISGCL